MNFAVATGDLAQVNPAHEAPMSAGGRFSDLGLRILSALILAPAGIGAVWAGGPWIAAATGAAIVAMCFEWSRMSERENYARSFILTLAGGLGAIMFASRGEVGWGMAWLGACALAAALFRETWTARTETLLGALYVGAPCALFVWLRDHGAEGLTLILFLFAAIWMADIFAYLGGTLIGGPKLHPQLSPQKTWSGIAAGTFAGAAAGAVFALMLKAEHVPLLALLGALTAATGLAGDLFESFLKRRFGVKDASGLIPGHGGVLDRIDGLMMATLAWAGAAAFAPGAVSELFGA